MVEPRNREEKFAPVWDQLPRWARILLEIEAEELENPRARKSEAAGSEG